MEELKGNSTMEGQTINLEQQIYTKSSKMLDEQVKTARILYHFQIKSLVC